MTSAAGPWVYEGARFKLRAIELPRRGGGVQRREVVVPADAVVILPRLDADTLVMIRNFRPAIGQTLWELPAGTLEPGEDPIEAAGRELEEETGYRAAKVEPLLSFFPTPGFCTERLYAFAATGLTHVGQSLDETERIEVHPRPWRQAMQMIERGEIVDAKSIATLLFFDRFRTRGVS